MSIDVDDWSPAELQAAMKAYQSAPEDATLGEVRAAVLAARDEIRAEAAAPPKVDYTREELVAICEAGVVPHEHWHDRDSARSQQKLGQAWAYLKAGCDFRVLTEGTLVTDKETIWIEIDFADFDWFESREELGSETFYLPTQKRLDRADGRDWY